MNYSSIHNDEAPIVIINKQPPHPDDTICLSRAHTLEALETLSPEAFFLYMHLVLGQDKDILIPVFADTLDFNCNMDLDIRNRIEDESHRFNPL